MWLSKFQITEDLKKKRVLNHYGGTKPSPTPGLLCEYRQKQTATTSGLVTIIQPQAQGVMTSSRDPRGRRPVAKKNPKNINQELVTQFQILWNSFTSHGTMQFYYRDGFQYTWTDIPFYLWQDCPLPVNFILTDIATLSNLLRWWNSRRIRTGFGAFNTKDFLGIPALCQMVKVYLPI
jgi:hypothetical protein